MGKLHVFNKLLSVLILFTFFANIYCFFRIGAKKEATAYYVRTCKTDKDPPQIFNINYFKYNHTDFAATANWTALEPFDKSYKLHIEIKKWADGGWKMNFLNVNRDDACGNLQLLLGSDYNKVLIAAGIKPKCPIEPGFYKLGTFVSSASKSGIDSPIAAFPGKFHVLVQILKHRKITACVEFEIDIYETYD